MTEEQTMQDLSNLEGLLRIHANKISKVLSMVQKISAKNPTQENLSVSEEYFLDSVNRLATQALNQATIDSYTDFSIIEDMYVELKHHIEV